MDAHSATRSSVWSCREKAHIPLWDDRGDLGGQGAPGGAGSQGEVIEHDEAER